MRRKHLAALAVFAIAIVTWGCKHANAEVQDTDSGTATGKTLVVYFSHQVPYEVDGVTGASYALKLIRERAGLACKFYGIFRNVYPKADGCGFIPHYRCGRTLSSNLRTTGRGCETGT